MWRTGFTLLTLAVAAPAWAQKERMDSYGDPLPEGAVARLGTLRGRQLGHPRGIAFSPDSKRFAAWGSYGFHVCDAFTGKTLLESPFLEVWLARFDADGNSGTAIVGGELIQWNLKPGRVGAAKLPHMAADPVALSRDGKSLAKLIRDNDYKVQKVGVFDAASAKLVHEISVADDMVPDKATGRPLDPILSLVFSPDGKRLALASQKSLSIWEFSTGKRSLLLKAPMPDGGFRAAFSPDGKTIVSCDYWEEHVRAHDVNTTKELWSVPTGDHHGTRVVSYSPDGKTVAHAGESGLIRLRDAATGKETGSLKTGRNTYHLAFSPDGTSLAGMVSLSGLEARVFDLATGKDRFAYPRHELRVEQIGFTSDGKRAITSGIDRTVRVWDATTGRHLFLTGQNEIKEIRQRGHPWALALDGESLLVANGDSVGVWSLATFKQRRQFQGPEGPILALATMPARKAVAAVSVELKGRRDIDVVIHTHAAHILDQDTGKIGLAINGLSRHVTQVQASPDATLLALGAPEESTVTVHDATNGRLTFQITLAENGNGPRVGGYAFSPDGKQLFVAADKIWAWDTASGKGQKAIPGPSRGYLSVAVSPNGRYLAARGPEAWYVFEAATGKVLWERAVSDSDAHAVAFSPDGSRLLTGGEGTALIWELPATVVRP